MTKFARLVAMVTVLAALSCSTATANDASSSFDSLVASQCRARCLAHYPWKQLATLNSTVAGNDRRHRSMWDTILAPRSRVLRVS